MSDAQPILLTILIKALNEEKHIAACLEAALKEAEQYHSEIILVDSLSTDNTVAIASQFPIRIIQFENIADRGCGAAVQLGYQYARGEYIYVLDADMEMEPGFLALAFNTLKADPTLAGVGGKVADRQLLTVIDKARAMRSAKVTAPKNVIVLGGGGLYRRSAIESVGYLANRWLPAFEELELGNRLISNGWHLLSLPTTFVWHTGHQETNKQLLKRLWQNGRAEATGMFLRVSFKHNWWWRALLRNWYICLTFFVHISALIASQIINPDGFTRFLQIEIVSWLLLMLGMVIVKRSFTLGAYSILFWHFCSIAALKGLMKPVADPLIPIPAKELR